MREIKFRGLYKGAMVYGTYIKAFYDGKPFYQIEHSHSDEFLQWEIENPETIGQFTGLKDANGVDIYEGDVLRWVNDKCICQFSEKAKFIAETTGSLHTEHDLYAIANKSVVIGNIHENPELLGWGDL